MIPLLASLNLLWVAGAAVAALAMGTIVRLSTLRGKTAELVRARTSSLRTWWIIVLVLIVAVWLSPLGLVVLFAAVSGMALYEFVELTGGQSATRRAAVWAGAVLIPLNYLWVWLGWEVAFAAFAPVAAVLLIATRQVLVGQTDGYRDTTSHLIWGALVTVYCLSHTVMLLSIPEKANPAAGAVGWVLYLLLLTELNDISQALVGRRLGRHKIARRVSPNKSWEGFLAGVTVTVALAVLLSRWFTPLPWSWAAGAGLLIAVSGLLGDLNISGIKRDTGVKDSGWLMPGQGGLLDRIDSLTFTAPLFYYYARIFLSLTGSLS